LNFVAHIPARLYAFHFYPDFLFSATPPSPPPLSSPLPLCRGVHSSLFSCLTLFQHGLALPRTDQSPAGSVGCSPAPRLVFLPPLFSCNRVLVAPVEALGFFPPPSPPGHCFRFSRRFVLPSYFAWALSQRVFSFVSPPSTALPWSWLPRAKALFFTLVQTFFYHFDFYSVRFFFYTGLLVLSMCTDAAVLFVFSFRPWPVPIPVFPFFRGLIPPSVSWFPFSTMGLLSPRLPVHPAPFFFFFPCI